MIIHLRSTEKMVTLNGVPARIWEGFTDNDIKMHAYITLVAVDQDEPRKEEFGRELEKHAPPSVEIQAIPLRLLI